jgi:2-amino-4-hydroxy-6-hydroxymethyldihydropteridine diphosphokinase
MVFLQSSQQFLPKASTNASGVYVGLGSNLSIRNLHPQEILLEAIGLMTQNADCVISRSSCWVTKAWPKNPLTPDYVNAVCKIKPLDFDPQALLERLLRIEDIFERARDPNNQWASRTLDLDLLDYDGLILHDNASLTLPHPRVRERDFVLLPLLEIAPDWCDPVTGEAGITLLERLETENKLNGCVKLVT